MTFQHWNSDAEGNVSRPLPRTPETDFHLGHQRKSLDFLLLIFTSLTIFIGTVYTMKHVGIERKLIEGQTACSSISDVSNTNDLLSIIQNAPIIRCDEPTLILNIISLAELNLITMSILLILNLTCIYQNVRKR